MQEIELKLKLPAGMDAREFLEDEDIGGWIVPGSEEELEMEAVYYDTLQKLLQQNHVAFRVRNENGEYVATLKWDSVSQNGFSVRNECNVEVSGPQPDLSVFRSDLEEPELLVLLDHTSGLRPIMTTRYTRRKAALDYEGSVLELAVDQGGVYAAGGMAPISEVEVELISGKTETLLKFGRFLMERFGLSPEQKSKFRRGLALLEKAEEGKPE